MDVAVLTKEELPIALRALSAIALSDGTFADDEGRVLAWFSRLHGEEPAAGALLPITPEEVARAITDPHRRKRLVQLALVMATVEGDVKPAAEQAVRALAAALEVDERGLQVLRDLAGGHALLARIHHGRRLLPFVREREGALGVLRMVRSLAGLGGTDPARAARYRALGALPEGTLGRAFHDHCASRGFAFPGEEGGVPEVMVFHDFGHVLSGYDTDPAGEIEQAAFQAGNVRRDGFLFLLFGIMQFHLGVRMTPAAPAERGYFDVDKVLRAVARGAACRVDLSDRWDPFAVAHLPLEQVRADYGIA